VSLIPLTTEPIIRQFGSLANIMDQEREKLFSVAIFDLLSKHG